MSKSKVRRSSCLASDLSLRTLETLKLTPIGRTKTPLCSASFASPSFVCFVMFALVSTDFRSCGCLRSLRDPITLRVSRTALQASHVEEIGSCPLCSISHSRFSLAFLPSSSRLTSSTQRYRQCTHLVALDSYRSALRVSLNLGTEGWHRFETLHDGRNSLKLGICAHRWIQLAATASSGQDVAVVVAASGSLLASSRCRTTFRSESEVADDNFAGFLARTACHRALLRPSTRASTLRKLCRSRCLQTCFSPVGRKSRFTAFLQSIKPDLSKMQCSLSAKAPRSVSMWRTNT